MIVWLIPVMIEGIDRKLHLEQGLAAGRAEHLRSLHRLPGDALNPEGGQSNRGGQGIDDGGEGGRHPLDAEEEDDRDEIDRCRDGLHCIQERSDQPLDA
jgi:hypothetical protein